MLIYMAFRKAHANNLSEYKSGWQREDDKWRIKPTDWKVFGCHLIYSKDLTESKKEHLWTWSIEFI